MEGCLKELAGYRLERAREMLSASENNLEIGEYKTSLNRSYYAVFHAMRSANALKGFDSSKHSGVIAFFTKEYLKTELLDRSLSFVIKASSLCREKSDYMISMLQAVQRQRNSLKMQNILCRRLKSIWMITAY